jgi:hypothetical protein
MTSAANASHSYCTVLHFLVLSIEVTDSPLFIRRPWKC